MLALDFFMRQMVTQTAKHVSEAANTEQRKLVDDAIPAAMGRSKYLSAPGALERLINTHSLPGYTRYDMCCVVFYDSKRDQQRLYKDLDECPVCGKSRWVEGKFRVEATKRYHHLPLKDVMASVYAQQKLLDEFVPSLSAGKKGACEGRVPNHITQTRGYAARLEKFPQFAHDSRNLLINLSKTGGVATASGSSGVKRSKAE